MTQSRSTELRFDIAAWVTSGTLLFLTIYLHLLPALLAGLLVYELVHVIAERITARTGGKVAAVGLLATLIVGLLVIAAAIPIPVISWKNPPCIRSFVSDPLLSILLRRGPPGVYNA